MFDLSALTIGLQNVFQWQNLLAMILGTAVGIVIGALPGFTATMGMAMLVPLTFGMSPETSLLLLSGVYAGAIYGGGITAVLVNIPGTPASMPTTFDGYPMAKKGEGARALGAITTAAALGGLASAVLLLVATPPLAALALRFGPPELFSLALFGLSVTSSMIGGNVLKGLIVAGLGLLLSTIGMDPIEGYPRFTFGLPSLMGGIELVPLLIGVFALPQVLEMAERQGTIARAEKVVGRVFLSFKEIKSLAGTLVRSSIIGMIIGIVPAAGPETATFISYDYAKRWSRNKEEFGKGTIEGVVASECAGNASTGGDIVPTITLGVPGSGAAAIYLGALYIQGLRPGPELFTRNAGVVYTMFVGFFLINIIMYFLGLGFSRIASNVVRMPSNILAPLVAVLSVVGSYADGSSLSNVWVMLIGGTIAYLMQKVGFSAVPIVISLILGPMAEANWDRSLLMSYGNLLIFITRPISLTLLVLSVFTLAAPLFGRKGNARETAEMNHSKGDIQCEKTH